MHPQELDLLVLGHLIQEEEVEDASSGRQHSKSRNSTRRKAMELANKGRV